MLPGFVVVGLVVGYDAWDMLVGNGRHCDAVLLVSGGGEVK